MKSCEQIIYLVVVFETAPKEVMDKNEGSQETRSETF